MATQKLGHGEVGRHEQAFTHLLPLKKTGYDPMKLAVLAAAMAGIPDTLSDGPDPEENLFIPAGYTYFGQFIDHDLTFDNTSTLNLDPRDFNDPDQQPSDLRSPRFDLDCLYGNGPGDQPYLYIGVDGTTSRGIAMFANASLMLGGDGLSFVNATPIVSGAWDLMRGPNGRALIGDKRNDENSIVNQIQQLFIMFHNRVVETLATRTPALLDDRSALFTAAQDQVRWAYQQIILDDFLPRLIDKRVLDGFKNAFATDGENAFLLYKAALRSSVPREFVAAAYRYGHSGVRQGYRLNTTTIRSIFLPDSPPQVPNTIDSLVGFDPLPKTHAIDDWGRFFPLHLPEPGKRLLDNDGVATDVTVADPSVPDANGKFAGDGRLRMQYSYKLDPSIVDPLVTLPNVIAGKTELQPATLQLLSVVGGPAPQPATGPSLALLNLLRGNRYRIQGGQAFSMLPGAPLDADTYFRVRVQTGQDANGDNLYSFTHIRNLKGITGGPTIGDAFDQDAPLWFYVLAEAQAPIVDLWIANGKKPLTEAQLRGRKADGSAAFPGAAAAKQAETAEELKATSGAGTQLGRVGGRIVAEVFYGLLDADRDSVFNRAPGGGSSWSPIWVDPAHPSGKPASMAQLIQFTITPQNGLVISDAPNWAV